MSHKKEHLPKHTDDAREHRHGDHGDGCGCDDGHHHDHDDCGCSDEHQHDHNDCICDDGHHHDHNDCSCSDGHHHDHDGCGDGHHHNHDNEHQHDHNDCGCSDGHHHDHDGCGDGHHHHEHGDGCGCGHHHDEPEHPAAPLPADGVRVNCLVEHLGCANCAAKMERLINELPEVKGATLTFATKQLRAAVTPEAAQNEEALIAKFQEICSSIEPEVTVKKQEASQKGKRVLSDAQDHDGKSHRLSEQQADFLSIAAGLVLFILGEILETYEIGGALLPSAIFVAAYLILGGQILLTAVKNLANGQIFDENFLMGIATIGAFAIGNFPEAVGVMLFYRIGEFFEEMAVARSRSQIMDAVDLRPEVVNLVRGDNISVIPAEDAQVGDVLLVRPGDRVPLDGKILEGESRLDTSPITGEPVPVKVSAGDPITSGCINTSGELKIQASQTLEGSMVTRILDSVENAAASKPKIDRFITRFSSIYTPFVVAAALLTAILPSLITGDWRHWIYTALTFLVISCPCALVLSVPLAFFSGIGAGSKRGILFKGGASIEALGRISTAIMDKTGTVTKGDFAVQETVALSGYGKDDVLRLCASCEQHSTHPIGASILAAAQEKCLALESASSIQEIAGHGIQATLPCGKALVGNQKLMEKFHVHFPDLKRLSYGTQVFLAIDGKPAGYLRIADTVKPEAAHAISSLKEMRVKTAMLTGDAPESAQAVASATGIDEIHAKLLPGEKLAKLQEIRNSNGSVLFVGDGINDAPVLAGADVGAAMGSGADAAIEAADVVFLTSNMDAVPDSISIARATTRIAWQNVAFALAVKILVMLLGLAGHASMWMAVFADSGVAMLCVLNSIRILFQKKAK